MVHGSIRRGLGRSRTAEESYGVFVINRARTFDTGRQCTLHCSGEDLMMICRNGFTLAAVFLAVATFAGAARAQETQYPKPTDLPNPYRLVQGWPTLPKSMNGGHWGEVIRVHVDAKGNIWVFHRCFNVVPPGNATCINRGEANPPILEFDASGKLLKSFGVGVFAYPHGLTIGPDGNLWASAVNEQEPVLGMSAKNAAGVIMGQEVLKLSPEGKVLMTLGKEGVAGTGP